jgi:hypothetical protein
LKNKTIAEYMKDVLIEQGFVAVCYGDCSLLDDCAHKCTHTNLLKLHPLIRHQRIFSALEKSSLFVKRYVRDERLVRCFYLKESPWISDGH